MPKLCEIILKQELFKVKRELTIEKKLWRRNGKGIHFDNIKTLRSIETKITKRL